MSVNFFIKNFTGNLLTANFSTLKPVSGYSIVCRVV